MQQPLHGLGPGIAVRLMDEGQFAQEMRPTEPVAAVLVGEIGRPAVAALNPLIADRTWCDGESVSQSLQASDHPVWHLRHGPALRVEVEKHKSVKSQEAHQPTQHPSFDRLPLASSGSRYQHNTRMAWPRLTRYDERVRRDRP